MKISVIIITRNRDRQLANAIAGLENSTMQPSEIVVVNFGQPIDSISSGKIPVVIEQYRGNREQFSLAKARNTGAAVARFENLLFLDVDCIPSDDLLGSLSSKMSSKTVLSAHPVYLRTIPLEIQSRILDEQSVVHPGRNSIPLHTVVDPKKFWSLVFMISASDFRSIGGFDEGYVGYGVEDTDFGMRFNKAGMELKFVEGRVYHQYHEKYDPPLNHFTDVVLNCARFKSLWGFWPMYKTLAAFKERGYLEVSDTNLKILRLPNEEELKGAKSQEPY